MSEQLCPECHRPQASTEDQMSAPGKCYARHNIGWYRDVNGCLRAQLARLKSKLALLEEALLAADRMRESDTVHMLAQTPLLKAYDQARERTRK